MISNEHTIDLDRCLQIAQLAALKAGNRIMEYFGGTVEIESKGFGYEKSDLVTKADKEAQEIIENHLHHFDHSIGFLGEENGFNNNTSRFEKDYFWSVDPLDGTKSFVSGNSGFAVSIGLTRKDGKAIMGVCYFPVKRNLYYAIYNKKAIKNDKVLINDRNKNVLKIYLSEAETLPKMKNEFYNDLVVEISKKNPDIKIQAENIVAPVEKACMTIDNQSETLYYGIPRKKLGVSIWDFAAVVPISEANNVHASDIFGNSLELNREDSTFIHHNGFLFTSNKEIATIVIDLAKHYKTRF
jgi:fructose-1,6-bisphosphatase/inositol monophosphatase family enzyme